MAVSVTGLVVGPKTRLTVARFVQLIVGLWEEDLVTPNAVVSVGPVGGPNVVAGATAVGAGRKVVWKGTDLEELVAAVRAAYDQDVAVWFAAVDADAFEPAEEEEYEDVPDEGDDEGDEGPEEAAPTGAPSPAAASGGLDEFELVPPSLVLYSVRTPVEIAETSNKPDAKKLKRFGPRAGWATLDGEDMSLFVSDLGDSWILDVLEEGFGDCDVGKLTR